MDNNKNKKISEKLFDVTVDRYNKEFERCQHLDNKAGTAIGFSGVIVSIIGIVFYSVDIVDIDDEELTILIFGIAILLLSIVFGITVLTKFKKTIPVFNPEGFYKDVTMGDKEKDLEEIFFIYLDNIYDLAKANELDAKLLYYGNITTLVGLTISFISFILIIK